MAAYILHYFCFYNYTAYFPNISNFVSIKNIYPKLMSECVESTVRKSVEHRTKILYTII